MNKIISLCLVFGLIGCAPKKEKVSIVNGKDGAVGATGLTGSMGETGATGATGETGAQGIAGAQGIKGDKGDKGETGASGSNGHDGSNGDKGDKGDHGDLGDRGSDGHDGSNGRDGDKGEKGVRTFTISETAYEDKCPSKGVLSTSFIDTNDNGLLDEGEVVTSAALVCNGDNGRDGERGSDGRNGDNGLDGSNGSDGRNGSDGLQGSKGDRGDKGLDGSNGMNGSKGDKGDNGASGVSQVIKPCSSKNARITRLPDGTLLSHTNDDGMTTLIWGVSGSNAPSYLIGGNNTCTVYVDFNGKICTTNPAKGQCASPL